MADGYSRLDLRILCLPSICSHILSPILNSLSAYMFYTMRALAFLTIVPLALSLQLPHFPTPQDTLDFAGSLIRSGHVHAGGHAAEVELGHANDMQLGTIGDEYVVLTHKKYPVGHALPEDELGYKLIRNRTIK